MNAIADAIAQLDRKLQGVPFGFAFLGGSVLSLLVTDPEACKQAIVARFRQVAALAGVV